MKMIFKRIFNFGILLFFGFGISISSNTKVIAEELNVNWEWKKGDQCYYKSPEIKLTGVPDDTATLRVSMVDVDNTSFNHGGGKVKYKGDGKIASGALRNYQGPCPPSTHRYEFTVKAKDESGKVLATGKGMRTCCDQFK